MLYELRDKKSIYKYNIFSILNDEEHDTSNTEALDALDLYNNSEGYDYKFEIEVVEMKKSENIEIPQ